MPAVLNVSVCVVVNFNPHLPPTPQSTIKQGDLLLNRVQKLSRVINM